jgi:TorA maturation chaperone TorD
MSRDARSMSRTAERAIELAATARLLSLGFSPPDEESLAEVETLARGLLETSSPPPELTELLEADWGTLQADYQALFGTPCWCIYESSYEPDLFSATRDLDELSGFYRAFGADTGGSRSDRPDHVMVELEFFSYLAAKRLAATSDDERTLCRGAEDAFLVDHLGRWFSCFCRCNAERATGFYSALSRLGERFIAEELAHRGLEPQPCDTPEPGPGNGPLQRGQEADQRLDGKDGEARNGRGNGRPGYGPFRA